MRPHQRQNEILASVRSRGACSIVELAAELQVSDETIRRNIKPLVRQGLVDKVHGLLILGIPSYGWWCFGNVTTNIPSR